MLNALPDCRKAASLLLTTMLMVSGAFSQSKQKPKLKDFGKSLKRLKWDPKLNQAVLTKSKSQQKDANNDDDDVVRVETSLVSSDLLVLDALGNPVSGLSEKDFAITEDDTPQRVGMFSLGENTALPRSVVLIIDYSSSQYPFIQTSVAAAKSMVDKLGPLDRLAIVTDDVELIQDFTTDKEQLKRKLDSLLKRVTNTSFWSWGPRFGSSKQYSALMATLIEAFSSEDQRPIIIFQTDGDQLALLRNATPPPPLPVQPPMPMPSSQKIIENYRTEFSFEDLCRAAEKSRVTIYTVVSGIQFLGLSKEEQMKRLRIDMETRLARFSSMPVSATIQRLIEWQMSPPMLTYAVDRNVQTQAALAAVASGTGGWAMFLERPSQADEIYSRIFSDMNRRYILGYYPTNKEHDGKRRRINITVPDHPDYTIVSRRWYYAPGPD